MNKQQNSNEPEILITNLDISSAIPQGNLTLPLPRLKVLALQLSGLFGTAYPPNFRKYFADGKSYFETDKNGTIDIARYGFRIPQSSAKVEMISASEFDKKLAVFRLIIAAIPPFAARIAFTT